MKWPGGRRAKDEDLDREIHFHLDEETKQRAAAGQTLEDARAGARRDFGSAALAAEAAREVNCWGWLDRFLQDTRQAARAIRRNPGFACSVSLILALGIGAVSTVFGLLNGIVFKPLPVERPDELVWFRDPGFSYPIFQEVRSRAGIFAGFFAWNIQTLSVDWDGEAQPAQALLASGEFYSTLGARPALGRLIGPEDDRAAVLSYGCWKQRFGLDPAVIGRTLRVEQALFTIAGVTAPDFFGVAPGMAPEVTIPLEAYPLLDPRNADALRSPGMAWLHLMGRLKPGLSRKQADGALQVFWPRVMEATTNPGMSADRRLRYLSRTTSLMPGRTGFSRIRNQFSQALWLLFALVALLMIVACATAANLMLARTSARRREVAVRLALGAGRARVARQLMLEGLALAALGALLGSLLASWAGGLLVKLMSTSRNPILLDPRPDGATIAFAACVAIAASIAFSLAPAVRSARADPGPALTESARVLGGGRERWRMRRWLVASQVALSMVLLAGAALFGRSLAHLLSLDPGFERANVLLIDAGGAPNAAFHQTLLDRVRAIPGVRSAGLSWVPPVSNEMGSWTQSIAVDGNPMGAELAEPVYFNAVSPGYFETLGTRLVEGRDFGPRDNPAAPRTAIVNQALARAFFAGRNPLGRHISIGRAVSRQNLEIVGVVRDSKYQRLQEPGRRIAYLPYQQVPELQAGANLVLEARTAGPSAAVVEAIRREARNLDRRVSLRFETLEERVRESLVAERAVASIAAFLGGVALLLASAGLYGLMAYAVARRANEIGIRIALGARPAVVQWKVLRETLALTGCGVAGGLAASLALGRLVSGMLCGLAATDPAALAAAGGLMLTVAMLAGYLPARRAARVDPVVALRS